MAWLKNFKTQLPIPASLLKWNSSDEDTRSVADVVDSKVSTSDLLERIYPVGSIYMSANGVNPQYLFGGTWTPIQDKFLLGAGVTYSAGATGGEASHKLTVNEMPAHSHGVSANVEFTVSGTSPAGSGISGIHGDTSGWGDYGGADWYRISVNNSGGNASHNNMPPYIVVYIWKRTA